MQIVFYLQNIYINEQELDSQMRDQVRSKLKKRKADEEDDDETNINEMRLVNNNCCLLIDPL